LKAASAWAISNNIEKRAAGRHQHSLGVAYQNQWRCGQQPAAMGSSIWQA